MVGLLWLFVCGRRAFVDALAFFDLPAPQHLRASSPALRQQHTFQSVQPEKVLQIDISGSNVELIRHVNCAAIAPYSSS